MSSDKTVKIRLTMSVSYIHNSSKSEVVDSGFTRAEWDDMTPDGRDKICDEIYDEFIWNYLDGGAEVIEEG